MTPSNSTKSNDITALDALTGGAFSAATAGERASRVKDWIASGPDADQLAAVFKELSTKDKGAARWVREQLDDLKRAKVQEAISAEWAAKAQDLLNLTKLNIADALAWQRDAAKAGAPLSKEPLAGLKTQINDRVRQIEDLQHQVQVQREAAVLLAQRIEVLSTKPWVEAQAALEALRTDVEHWQSQATDLVQNVMWPSIDLKYVPLLEASRSQLLVVWDAFQAAVAQTIAASADPAAPLPPVPVWADELRQARGIAVEPTRPTKAVADPAVRAKAVETVQAALSTLEREVGEGHGKASAGAAAALRQALKDFGRLLDGALEARANAVLAAAGELEGWQRWRADQLREELIAKAEGLLKRPVGQEIGGRKMQDNLRNLREQWKQTDQGGAPNHALWKRFDEACNLAHKVVEAWLEKSKVDAAQHKAERLALIDEVNQWAAANRTALDDDWKGFNRILHQFGDRWRDGGHVGEKVFAELQPLWKQAIANAAEPLETLQAQSLVARKAMIDEAEKLGAAPVLRVDAVKALQQRWQTEAHRVPIDRRQEQKLWDAFRKPIDEAFNRKSKERELAEAALGARDKAVLEAAKALDAANRAGDAGVIRAAMAALEAALRGQAQAQIEVKTAGENEAQAKAASGSNPLPEQPSGDQLQADASSAPLEAAPPTEPEPEPEPVAKPAPKPVSKPVVAVRGDDRPGMKKETAAAPPARGGKWNDRKDSARGPRDSASAGGPRREERPRAAAWQEAPRLGDTAFRAQRDALENAQQTLKKLAAQAHGEALTQLLTAWDKRDASLMPTIQDLGSRVSSQTRQAWQQAISSQASTSPGSAASVALLRLEMAAETPTPAEFLADRRNLQLQLLTRRNDPAPAQTWGQDTAQVLAGAFSEQASRRLQNVLKVMLRR